MKSGERSADFLNGEDYQLLFLHKMLKSLIQEVLDIQQRKVELLSHLYPQIKEASNAE